MADGGERRLKAALFSPERRSSSNNGPSKSGRKAERASPVLLSESVPVGCPLFKANNLNVRRRRPQINTRWNRNPRPLKIMRGGGGRPGRRRTRSERERCATAPPYK
ncbi:hypothetical protein EVAR_54094_1 [Eumeta japonica]|uniref:Uncharacterized protein n=1 Tax=Eumeta variegata TaxID=151549 RepID=A0A4C1Z2Q6_EUMVA|nr:hypothetical protein EVAR_54094_1 [Eumeta japonica]